MSVPTSNGTVECVLVCVFVVFMVIEKFFEINVILAQLVKRSLLKFFAKIFVKKSFTLYALLFSSFVV